MMGFPENHTAIELAASGMPLSLRQPSGSGGQSLITTKCSTEVETVGLTISSDVTYEEWENIGYELARVGKGWQWWVGDWINFGEKKYGETYKAAIEATGLTYGGCKNIAIVCRNFEMARRRAILSFKHHAEVQGLEPKEQDELLSEAESERLSCAAVRERVRAMKGICADSADEKVACETEGSVVAEDQNDGTDVADDVFVQEFQLCENRIHRLRLIFDSLADYERLLLADWLSNLLESKQ